MAVLDGCHVLLVDDDPDTADLHAFVLRSAGAVVHVGRDGEEALRILATERVDVLVTDIMMPDVDGFELLRQVQRVRPGLPAIAVSARAERDMRPRAIAAGYLDYRTKPLHPQDLVTATRIGCAAAGALTTSPVTA